ncbi:zf-HC2 domain-containing protein [Streptomyces sp. NPDC002088]|uniref:zf-HC2 domain-containing protein n=1 Tax=Streptomyces sp. NPDC002088 TaxID=3154665 RepID=UPI00332C0972
MASDVTCEKLRDIGAELALGVLPGRERAEAVAHLDRCAACREYVEQLTLVGDGLIGLLPDREPPPGFETRVARCLAQDAATHEGRSAERASGSARQGMRDRARRARLRIASVAVAFAVACGFAGWAIGTVVEEITASPPAAVESEPVLVGDLTSTGGGTEPVGEVYAHPGNPGWVFMDVELTGPGTPYSGRATCLLERSDGTTVRVGAFDLRDGRGQWGGSAAVDLAAVSGARLVSADGTVLASARLQTGQVVTRES